MKKIVVLLAMLYATTFTAMAQQVTMMVASDTHVMDKSLFDVPYGEAFMKAMQRDLKVAERSQQLFEQFIQKVIKEKPQLLLIPGDLTKDGERVSHEYVASKLKEVKKNGTKVYVIPGNHDMENPLAYSYHGAKAEKVPSISEKDFQNIYSECGYSEAVATDSLTGSYMVYPTSDLAIICINSNIPNRFKSRYVHGRIYSNTLSWIESAAITAHNTHRYVIAMIHHEVMQHHNQENFFAPTAMINMEKNVKGLPSQKIVQESLARAGVQMVLTGHYHIQSVNKTETLYGTLTDVSTGSLSGFPSPYRYITLNPKNGKVKITSNTLHGNKTSRWPTTELAQKQMQRLKFMVQIYVPAISNKKKNMEEAYKYLANDFNKALCALAAGDETGHQPKKVHEACMKAFDKYVLHTLNYNAIAVNKIRQDKNGPYKKVSDLIHSIMYNYVGSQKNKCSDNSYTLTLKR